MEDIKYLYLIREHNSLQLSKSLPVTSIKSKKCGSYCLQDCLFIKQHRDSKCVFFSHLGSLWYASYLLLQEMTGRLKNLLNQKYMESCKCRSPLKNNCELHSIVNPTCLCFLCVRPALGCCAIIFCLTSVWYPVLS